MMLSPQNRLSPADETLIAHLKARADWVSGIDLASETGLSRNTVSTRLRLLNDSGDCEIRKAIRPDRSGLMLEYRLPAAPMDP